MLFGMNFLSKCKKKHLLSLKEKEDPSQKRICTSTSFLGRVLLSALVLYQKENVATPPVLGSKGDVHTLGIIPWQLFPKHSPILPYIRHIE